MSIKLQLKKKPTHLNVCISLAFYTLYYQFETKRKGFCKTWWIEKNRKQMDSKRKRRSEWKTMKMPQKNQRGSYNQNYMNGKRSRRKRWGQGWRDMEMVKDKWSEGYVKECVFVVESQLLSPWGFIQLSCTNTHLLCSLSHISTP